MSEKSELATTYFPQGVAPPVSSALRRFTSVFGMGTGGPTAQQSPAHRESYHETAQRPCCVDHTDSECRRPHRPRRHHLPRPRHHLQRSPTPHRTHHPHPQRHENPPHPIRRLTNPPPRTNHQFSHTAIMRSDLHLRQASFLFSRRADDCQCLVVAERQRPEGHERMHDWATLTNG